MFGWQVERLADVGESAPQLGDHPRDLRRVLSQVFAHDLRRHDRQRLLDHFDERRVRNRALRLVAATKHCERAPLLGLADQLAHERGLPDAGLAADEHETAAAFERGHELGSQRRHLGVTPDEHLLHNLGGLPDPHDLPQAPRLGEPLELMLANVVEGHVRDRSRELAGHIRHENLSARCLGADARRCVHDLARKLAVL